MKIPEAYRCDSCGKARENDANRWWLLELARVDSGMPFTIVVRQWNAIRAKENGVKHACGED